jgi:hemoglobin
VRVHPTLATVFNPRLEGRWDPHLNQMKRFWSSVLLQSGIYQGHPLGAHFGVPGMQREHFADWLDLFRQTLDGIYAEQQADLIHARAQRIASRFSYALFTLVPQENGNQDTR